MKEFRQPGEGDDKRQSNGGSEFRGLGKPSAQPLAGSTGEGSDKTPLGFHMKDKNRLPGGGDKETRDMASKDIENNVSAGDSSGTDTSAKTERTDSLRSRDNVLKRKEIKDASLQAARSIVDSLPPLAALDYDDEREVVATAVLDFAKSDAARKDVDAARIWGKRLEEVATTDPYNALKANFLASTLGDSEASDRLHEGLDQERQRAIEMRSGYVANGTVPEYHGLSGGLFNVIGECVASEPPIPPQGWIEKYSIDPNHADILKLSYYSRAKLEDSPTEALAIGRQLRDEATQAFLDGELPDEVAMRHASMIIEHQEDPERAKAVFEKTLTTIGDMLIVSTNHYNQLIHTSERWLDNAPAVTQENAQRLQEYVGNANEAFTSAGVHPFVISNMTAPVEVRLSHYFGKDPEEIADQINQSTVFTAYHAAIGLSSEDRAGVEAEALAARDYLNALMTGVYAREGSFTAANTMLRNITSDFTRANTANSYFSQAGTSETLEAMAPLVAFDPKLEDAYATRKVFVNGDVNEIKEFAMDRANKGEAMTHLDWETIRSSIFALEIVAPAAAAELRHNLIDTFSKDKGLKGDALAIAEMDYADPVGLKVLFDNATEKKDPINQLREYTRLARFIKE